MTGKVGADARNLLRCIADGDRGAFERLYDHHARVVLNFLFRILRNQSDAEEVLQEVFWQVWRNAARYDPRRGAAEAWLFTMARTRAIDFMRSSRRVAAGPLDELPEPRAENTVQGLDPPDQRLVNEAFGRLSNHQRQVLALAYYQGMTQTEIAEHVGAPLGTVKTWVRSGLEAMRASLVANGWTSHNGA